MANVAKNAILRAKISGVLTEIMVKTNAANVYIDDSTTLVDKLAELVASIAEKANAAEMETALAGKAAASHTHEQSEVNGLIDALATKATTTALNEAIDALRQELLGDVPVEAYNTFTELAQYIEEHQEAADALTEAIGTKADKSTVEAIQQTLNGLGALATKSEVSESDLDTALAEKVNAAAEGNHSHANKGLLDTYTQTEADLADAVTKKHSHANATVLDGITADKVSAWDAAEQNAKGYADGLNDAMDIRVKAVEGTSHTHTNKTVLDGITAENVSAWNGKANVYYSATEPANLTENDLWVAIVE